MIDFFLTYYWVVIFNKPSNKQYWFISKVGSKLSQQSKQLGIIFLNRDTNVKSSKPEKIMEVPTWELNFER